MKKDIETDLISVIVPIFNVEAYLRPCIESILASTYTTLQIILVNDGSTDHSGEICDEYTRKDTRIEVIHQKNAGLSPARNSGMKAAKENTSLSLTVMIISIRKCMKCCWKHYRKVIIAFP
jgi:hypothetical protein